MNKPTVYDALKSKLGREPTHIELVRDVQRIFREAREDREQLHKSTDRDQWEP